MNEATEKRLRDFLEEETNIDDNDDELTPYGQGMYRGRKNTASMALSIINSEKEQLYKDLVSMGIPEQDITRLATNHYRVNLNYGNWLINTKKFAQKATILTFYWCIEVYYNG